MLVATWFSIPSLPGPGSLARRLKSGLVPPPFWKPQSLWLDLGELTGLGPRRSQGFCEVRCCPAREREAGHPNENQRELAVQPFLAGVTRIPEWRCSQASSAKGPAVGVRQAWGLSRQSLRGRVYHEHLSHPRTPAFWETVLQQI